MCVNNKVPVWDLSTITQVPIGLANVILPARLFRTA
jgi:hypothetical protein